MKRSKAAVLGLTALALLATSALVASGAQGTPILKSHPEFAEKHTPKITHHFECLDEEHVELVKNCTGHGEEAKTHRSHPADVFPEDHEFTIALGGLTCEEVTFTVAADADGTSETAPTTPHYDECVAFGSNPAHVTTNGCHYEFNIEETVETEKPQTGYEETEGKGSSTIACPEEGPEAITVEFEGIFGGECLIEVRPQATITPIYFRNKTETTTDLTVEAATATTISHFSGGFFNCGANGQTHSTYTGNTTVTGEINDPHEQVNLRFDDGKAHTE